jgi:hypothetical protein
VRLVKTLLAAAATLSLGVGAVYAGENEGRENIAVNPESGLPRSDLAAPGVAVVAPVNNAPPVAATEQNRLPILLH